MRASTLTASSLIANYTLLDYNVTQVVTHTSSTVSKTQYKPRVHVSLHYH